MGVIVKKCLACGTINSYGSKTCKSCNSSLLAEVDQEDELMSMDPMEAAVNTAVASVDDDDDMVAQILREQALQAKKLVAKEIEREERKQKRQKKATSNAPFSRDPVQSTHRGFTLGGESSGESNLGSQGPAVGATYSGLDGSEKAASEKYGFKIAKESDAPVLTRRMSAAEEASATWSRTTHSGHKQKKKEEKPSDSTWKIKKPEE